jgi:5-methyltetrahydropteroyltriglutamate--homocysteine methyltransferase
VSSTSLPDKDILLGVLDLSTPEVEDVATIKQRVRRALDHVNPRRVVLAPDCGMKYLSPEVGLRQAGEHGRRRARPARGIRGSGGLTRGTCGRRSSC